jgi:hypothetical protein
LNDGGRITPSLQILPTSQIVIPKRRGLGNHPSVKAIISGLLAS